MLADAAFAFPIIYGTPSPADNELMSTESTMLQVSVTAHLHIKKAKHVDVRISKAHVKRHHKVQQTGRFPRPAHAQVSGSAGTV